MRPGWRRVVRGLSGSFLVAVALGAEMSLGAQEPDLIPDGAFSLFLVIEERYFPPGHCAIVEGCVGAPGVRKLLRFPTQVINFSQTDLSLGPPGDYPPFVFSPCHGHYHIEGFADYRLRSTAGHPDVLGHKQAFCLADSFRFLSDPWVPLQRRYDCDDQGIQRGWSDVYQSNLDCQWIDVTGAPNGPYVIDVTVNAERSLVESNYENNSVSAPTVLTDIPGVAHRPDGVVVPGQPLLVGREQGGTGGEQLFYDAVRCPATTYNLLYGLSPPVSFQSYTGAICDVHDTDVVSLPEPGPDELLWFTIVGVSQPSGVLTEGGHGFSSGGVPRALSGVGFCGVEQKRPRFCSD